MKYAHIDEKNQLLGWYDDAINSEIPTPNIEITDIQWKIAIDNNHNKVNNDGTTEIFDFRTPDQVKAEHNASVLAQISEIESKQARPLREAFSADEVIKEQAMKYLKQYNDEIKALREQLL